MQRDVRRSVELPLDLIGLLPAEVNMNLCFFMDELALGKEFRNRLSQLYKKTFLNFLMNYKEECAVLNPISSKRLISTFIKLAILCETAMPVAL